MKLIMKTYNKQKTIMLLKSALKMVLMATGSHRALRSIGNDGTFYGNKLVLMCMSNTSTETAGLKIFT